DVPTPIAIAAISPNQQVIGAIASGCRTDLWMWGDRYRDWREVQHCSFACDACAHDINREVLVTPDRIPDSKIICANKRNRSTAILTAGIVFQEEFRTDASFGCHSNACHSAIVDTSFRAKENKPVVAVRTHGGKSVVLWTDSNWNSSGIEHLTDTGDAS